jgi:hypothetical protein
MRLAENESRQVGMTFKAQVELSRKADGVIPRSELLNFFPKLALGFHTRDLTSFQP